MKSPAWGAHLLGHDFDLQDWGDALKPPFDPWVERRDGGDPEAE